MTLTEIRNALIVIAENNQRPQYEMYIAKELYIAIKNDAFHPLKSEVQGVTISSTPLSKSKRYADPTAHFLDTWINEKKSRESLLLEKLRIRSEFLFDLRFGLLPAAHPIWTEVEAVIAGNKA